MRAAAALETRRRIVDAAADCFTREGYSATTMRAIARTAGVSVETVNGHGPKRELLFAAFELAFNGQEGGRPAAERPDFAAALDAPDPVEFLRLLIHALTAAFSRVDGIWRAVTAAADVDPAVRETLEELVKRRRLEFAMALTELQRRGLGHGGNPDTAIDALSLVLSPESFRHLATLCGWSEADYERWALRTALDQLAALDKPAA